MLESKLQKIILLKLDLYQVTGDVIFFQHLAAESDRHTKAGTPDIIAIINCKNGKIATLFIELKRTGVKRLRYTQQEFFNNMEGQPMILCVMINDPAQLWPAIKKARDL